MFNSETHKIRKVTLSGETRRHSKTSPPPLSLSFSLSNPSFLTQTLFKDNLKWRQGSRVPSFPFLGRALHEHNKSRNKKKRKLSFSPQGFHEFAGALFAFQTTGVPCLYLPPSLPSRCPLANLFRRDPLGGFAEKNLRRAHQTYTRFGFERSPSFP